MDSADPDGEPLYLIGVDGGGTRTTLALADLDGREILRSTGAPGLVDPRDPDAAVQRLSELVRQTTTSAGLERGAGSLCAGLAGVRRASERERVESTLRGLGVARRVVVRSDGEIALQGALGSRAGILLIAGTGSVAWGRSEDGHVRQCGGWGLVMGDEGSGFAVGRASLRAVARALDGRAEPTRLLGAILDEVGATEADALREWANTASKREIAALARLTAVLASEGDAAAAGILAEAASALAAHAGALCQSLGPWREPIPVVLHGGLTHDPGYARRVEAALHTIGTPVRLHPAAADPVRGALHFALEELRSSSSRRR